VSRNNQMQKNDHVPGILVNIWENWRQPGGRGPCADCPAHWSRRDDIPDDASDKNHSYGMDPWYGDGSLDAEIVIVGEEPGTKEADPDDNRTDQKFSRTSQVTDVPDNSGTIRYLDVFFEHLQESNKTAYWTEMKKCNEIADNTDENTRAQEVCCGLDKGRAYLAEELSTIDPDIVVPLGEPATENLLKLYNLGISWGKDFSTDIANGSAPSGIHKIRSHSAPFDIVPISHPGQGFSNIPKSIRNIDGEYESKKRNYYLQVAKDIITMSDADISHK
jgi:uracil-DNA glycosylase family 4